jgi:glucan phosphoethanolaminetransferase (alkaline phosphatase superfamily)
MFLTVHAASGIVIGQYMTNPILAFIIGFILHYIIDMIPHGDTKVNSKYKNPIHIGTAALFDFIILFFILISLLFAKVNLFKPSIITGMLGAMLPDILQGFYYIYRGKFFKKMQNIHNFFHDAISQKYEMSFILGIIFQLIILIILIFIII